MPEVKITIGGREFEVACQDGEEHYLHSAASYLDAEASVLNNQIGRMPETRMLLMSGLMLADKTAGIEERIKSLEEKLATQERLLEELRNRPEPEAQTEQQMSHSFSYETVTQKLIDNIAKRHAGLIELRAIAPK